MDQQKTGMFLKQLRKEKELTQEALAERFFVSNRTVSRWETGSNLPDVGTLIDLADFYGVDIRELIDGERKTDRAEQKEKETLLKVASYAAEGEKQTHFKTAYFAMGIAAVLFLSTILFSSEAPGLLCGIVPNRVCYYIMAMVYGLVFLLFLFYLRVRPFCEKPSWEPFKTVAAEVIFKSVKSGTYRSGRTQGGYSFTVMFRTAGGQELELYAHDVEFGGLREGQKGTLTYRGRYFVDFQSEDS